MLGGVDLSKLKKQNTFASGYDDGNEFVEAPEDIWSDANSDPGSPRLNQRETLKLFTGDEDETLAPIKKKADRLPWWYFNSDFYSTDRTYAEVK